MTTPGYFTDFCAFFGSEKCHDVAERAERGTITKEKAFEWFLNTFGEDKVAEAHQYASNLLQHPAPAQTPPPLPSSPPPPPATYTPPTPPLVHSDMAVKVKQMQQDKATQKPADITAPFVQPTVPNPPSEISNLCRLCVAPPTMGIFETVAQWYTHDTKALDKIHDLEDKIEREEINIEDAWTELLTDVDGSIDGVNKILGDLNRVIEVALNQAAQKKPALRKRFEQELQEMHGEEEAEE